jgi:dGTPase
MKWTELLDTSRLRTKSLDGEVDVRSQFQRDADRIVYSSAFRRLQDKTQVVPLSKSDYIRTRLTHSIEVATVGRSLGTLAGAVAREIEQDPKIPAPGEFGLVVAAACLSHDIGNPPFGHAGEDAIRQWFVTNGARWLEPLTMRQRQDFYCFEGNAQGFRILTRLQHPRNAGGLELTHATLSTFAKYPRASLAHDVSGKQPECRKFGFFEQDLPTFSLVAEKTGLIRVSESEWCRHPLAFLVEAADDICYRVVDLEDGHRIGRVTFDEVRNLLLPLAFPAADRIGDERAIDGDEKEIVEDLRALAINTLIYEVRDNFRTHYSEIMSGSHPLDQDLISGGRYANELKAIKTLSKRKIFRASDVVSIEAAGHEILGGLLSKFVPALLTNSPNAEQRTLLNLVPSQFKSAASPYDKLLAATDFISGMTDSYALSLFRRLKGIELP